MGIKTYQEKNAKPMGKELAQSDIPVKRKIQKNIQKCHYPEIWHFLGPLDILDLVQVCQGKHGYATTYEHSCLEFAFLFTY